MTDDYPCMGSARDCLWYCAEPFGRCAACSAPPREERLAADLRDFGALLALPPGGPAPAREAWMDWRTWEGA